MGSVQLGKSYKDSISGFEGIATVRTDLMGGRTFYTLTKQVNADGKVPRETFDFSRLRDSKGNEVNAPKLPKSEIQFGEEYMDRITGLKGKTTQRAQHVDGCVQWALDPPVNEKGELVNGYFFDDVRILAVETKLPVEKNPASRGPDTMTVSSPARS